MYVKNFCLQSSAKAPFKSLQIHARLLEYRIEVDFFGGWWEAGESLYLAKLQMISSLVFSAKVTGQCSWKKLKNDIYVSDR